MSEKDKDLHQRNEKMALTARLTRSIGHEIRNPLYNITLAIDAIEHETEASGELSSYIAILKRNVDRISTLIRELLESSRPASVDIQNTTAEIITSQIRKTTLDRFKLREIDLEISLPENEIKLNADPVQLPTALSNLVINALEAIKEPNGKVSIEVESKDDFCFFRISDSGIGMDEEEQKLLFDPFYTNKKGGLGLGLTLAQNIIAAHQGKIEVQSKKGEGSTFIIALPQH